MGLLDLPPELRNHIFEYFLDDAVSPPWHPWDTLPSHHRFRDYLALLLTSRQVHDECDGLFHKHYPQRLTFFFENIWDLLDFKALHASNALFADARFVLRTMNVKEGSEEGRYKSATETFTVGQPGFDQRWLLMPGLYVTDPQPHPRQYHRFASDNRSSGVRDGRYWDAKRNGFQQRAGDHSRCYPVDKEKCKPFIKLVYPPLHNGCEITCYSWGRSGQQSPTLLYGNVWPACMAMEGRLKAFDIPASLEQHEEPDLVAQQQQQQHPLGAD